MIKIMRPSPKINKFSIDHSKLFSKTALSITKGRHITVVKSMKLSNKISAIKNSLLSPSLIMPDKLLPIKISDNQWLKNKSYPLVIYLIKSQGALLVLKIIIHVNRLNSHTNNKFIKILCKSIKTLRCTTHQLHSTNSLKDILPY